ncbi:MAG: beta-propeller domain-containing protein [Candidatus Dojkabacteria bacterium]|nr:beta-propeller domain-containing protein [Candidatus Dojkabacteria bacterium]
MSSKQTLTLAFIVFALILCLFSSGIGFLAYRYYNEKNSNNYEPLWLPKLSDTMTSFQSDEEFDNYIAKVEDDFEKGNKNGQWPGGWGVVESDMGAAPASETKESITNVQEMGVDEGDIVKAYKDFLVILRRGKIFTVSFRDTSRDELRVVSSINAYPDGFTQGTWYDEMLIYENRIVVIGYSYQLSKTELNIFTINDKGMLSHQNSYYIDSNDYYSSRNYASRLVDDQLIFYMPYYLFTYSYSDGEYRQDVTFPKVRKWTQGNDLSEGREILKKTDIYKPVQNSYSPTLHTVVKCDLDSDNFDCTAKAILGPYSRNFYVSQNAIYVWISDENNIYSLEEEEVNRDDPQSNSYVYMFLINDSTARVLRADGSPIDQFSFKEDADGFLNVVVREYTSGDAMWNPESTGGDLALLRVSLEEFGSEPREVKKESYSELPAPDGYTLQNKFIGDYLLYGSGSNWYYDENAESNLYVYNYKTQSDTRALDLGHSIDRIEALGSDAVVIGTDTNSLIFSSIRLKDSPNVQDTYSIKNAQQGELRSHGFFYKEYVNDGILGLPILGLGEELYESLFNDSAQIVFLNVNEDLNLEYLGVLNGTPPEEENPDNCKFSCTDWYGNSRPIFYSDRIFGLMGYELIEGSISAETLNEIDRLNFLE